jgi:hypothetical protein
VLTMRTRRAVIPGCRWAGLQARRGPPPALTNEAGLSAHRLAG